MYLSVMYVRKNKSMNLENFFNKQRLADMEKKATLILSNPKFKTVFIIIVGTLLFYTNPVYAADPFSSIGWKFWGYVKTIGRFSCLIMGGVETIKSLSSGDTKSIAKILFKYLIGYSSFTLLPYMFDLLDKEFKL